MNSHYLTVMDWYFYRLGSFTVVEFKDTLASLVVTSGHCGYVLGGPFNRYVTISAAHSLNWNPNFASTFLSNDARFDEFKLSRFYEK